jgi:chemotaxis protein CheC
MSASGIEPGAPAAQGKDFLVAIEYNELQLDALRELANIGAGTAATALSQMLGQEVTLTVSRALAPPLAEAVASAGPPEEVVSGVVIPL